MDAHTALGPTGLFASPYAGDIDPGNGGLLVVDRQFKMFELDQATASTQETRILSGPQKSGLICKIVATTIAAGGSVQIALRNSAATTTAYVTISTAGTGATLESWRTGVGTWQWVVTFSNA